MNFLCLIPLSRVAKYEFQYIETSPREKPRGGAMGSGGDGGRFSRFPLNLLPGNLTICTGLRSQGLEILCGFIGLIDLNRS